MNLVIIAPDKAGIVIVGMQVIQIAVEEVEALLPRHAWPSRVRKAPFPDARRVIARLLKQRRDGGGMKTVALVAIGPHGPVSDMLPRHQHASRRRADGV